MKSNDISSDGSGVIVCEMLRSHPPPPGRTSLEEYLQRTPVSESSRLHSVFDCQSPKCDDAACTALPKGTNESVPHRKTRTGTCGRVHCKISPGSTQYYDVTRFPVYQCCDASPSHSFLQCVNSLNPLPVAPWSFSSHPPNCLSLRNSSGSDDLSHRVSISTLGSSENVSISSFQLSQRRLLSCYPRVYIHLMRRDRRSLLRGRNMTSRNRKQTYVVGAILIVVGLTSVIVNIVGTVIHASWTFTGIGLWAGICNLVSGWAAILTAQQKKYIDFGHCLGGLGCCAAVCSGLQASFGVVGLTVRDFHFSLDMDVPDGSMEVNVALIVSGLAAALLNCWMTAMTCRKKNGIT